MTTVTVQEAQARLSNLFHQLTPGEEVVITAASCLVRCHETHLAWNYGPGRWGIIVSQTKIDSRSTGGCTSEPRAATTRPNTTVSNES